MRIAHFNTVDCVGGAAKVAYRLHGALNSNYGEVNSSYYVKIKTLQDDTVKAPKLIKNRSIDNAVTDLYINNHRTDIANTLFSFTYTGEGRFVQDAIRNNDIFHLHWIENFLNLDDIHALQSSGKSVIYTLHDERPYTGGCHCTFDCVGFMSTCSHCEQLEQRSHVLPKAVLQDRINILNDSNIKIIAPSEWIKSQAEKSSVFHDADIEVIPHGIDTKIYKYVNKVIAKESIGIEADVMTLMFNAHNCNATHKGYKYFFDALSECYENTEFEALCRRGKIRLLIVGGNVPEHRELIPTTLCGYITEEEQMASLYQATDILVNPTLAESFSLVSLESMACGAIVVGFKTGGMIDYITHDNGRLVAQRDSKALAESIIELLVDRGKLETLSKNCVSTVHEKYDIREQTNRYLKIYDNSRIHKKRNNAKLRVNQAVEEKIISTIRIKSHARLEYVLQHVKRAIKKVPMSGIAIIYIKKMLRRA